MALARLALAAGRPLAKVVAGGIVGAEALKAEKRIPTVNVREAYRGGSPDMMVS